MQGHYEPGASHSHNILHRKREMSHALTQKYCENLYYCMDATSNNNHGVCERVIC